MAIKYTVAQRAEAGVKGGGNPKYYAMAGSRELVGFEELAQQMEKRTSATGADAMLIFYNLASLIPELIKEGKSIKHDGIGIISGTLVAEGKDTPEDVTSQSIKGIKLHFLPDVKMKKKLKDCEFEKVK
jgi:predicted histone-like DNA-binding protein